MQKIIVKGQPQGKLRARHGKNPWTGKPQTYTPEKTRAYEELIGIEYQVQHGAYFADKYVRLCVLAFYGIPKSYTKSKQQQAREGTLRPSVKPDADNVIKAVADALNGVAYDDDTQVVEVLCKKYYSDDPRIEIYIEEAKAQKEAKS